MDRSKSPERRRCHYGNLSSFFVLSGLTPAARRQPAKIKRKVDGRRQLICALHQHRDLPVQGVLQQLAKRLC